MAKIFGGLKIKGRVTWNGRSAVLEENVNIAKRKQIQNLTKRTTFSVKMLRSKSKLMSDLTQKIQSRQFQTSILLQSKIGKRRKVTKLNSSPNLQTASMKQERPPPTKLAMNFFDDHYKQTLGPEWHSIRLALLSKPKFAALVNNFSDKTSVSEELKSLGCLSLKELFNNESENIDCAAGPGDSELTSLDLAQSPQLERPSKMEDKDDGPLLPDIVHKSMDKEDAKDRIIHPDSIVIGGKTSAAMYEFMPPDGVKGVDDFMEESHYYSTYKHNTSDIPFPVEDNGMLEFPEKLDAFIFPNGVLDHFKSPRRLHGGPFNYYCLDAASLLPVLMLDLKTGEHLLDLCSGPGGKSLTAMQTLKLGRIVCNDNAGNRTRRVSHVMNAYLFDDFNPQMGRDVIQYSVRDGQKCPEVFEEQFDKVLCDVPCFTDRNVIFNEEGNVFHPTRVKERLRMPELQSQLLQASLRCVKPGGTVVYSTCTISPMQNDGVVYSALKSVWADTKMDLVICDLSKAVQPFKTVMKFADPKTHNLKFGQQILPHVGQNFGPMYFAKIKRLS